MLMVNGLTRHYTVNTQTTARATLMHHTLVLGYEQPQFSQRKLGMREIRDKALRDKQSVPTLSQWRLSSNGCWFNLVSWFFFLTFFTILHGFTQFLFYVFLFFFVIISPAYFFGNVILIWHYKKVFKVVAFFSLCTSHHSSFWRKYKWRLVVMQIHIAKKQQTNKIKNYINMWVLKLNEFSLQCPSPWLPY